MNEKLTAHRSEHREIHELLSWYANETLSDGDRERVEEHLASCLTCRQEADFLGGLRRTLAEPDDLLLKPERSLERLGRRIDALEAGRHGELRWRDVASIAAGRLRHLLGLPTAPLRLGLAASLLTLAVTLGWVVHSGLQPRFQTLADPAAAPAPASRPALRVVFADDLEAAEIRRLLEEIGGSVAAGPSTWGVYTVELAAGADPLAALERLRAHPGVRFAEPTGRHQPGEEGR